MTVIISAGSRMEVSEKNGDTYGYRDQEVSSLQGLTGRVRLRFSV